MIASQPAKAHTNRLIASATPAQPWQERLEIRGLRGGHGTRHDDHDHDDEQRAQSQLHAAADPKADPGQADRDDEESGAHRPDPLARQADDRSEVLAAERRDDGSAEAAAEEEPVAGHPGGGSAEREPHERRHSPGIREPRGERRESSGERDRDHEHDRHREDRRRPGGIGGEAGQHEDAGAEHCGDVEGGC
ncbi:MAG: hypothetical protein WBL06_00095 [Pseudolysinimonas sp.]